jgi:hypothetical protein
MVDEKDENESERERGGERSQLQARGRKGMRDEGAVGAPSVELGISRTCVVRRIRFERM